MYGYECIFVNVPMETRGVIFHGAKFTGSHKTPDTGY